MNEKVEREKTCPVCGIDYAPDAEFCAKCKAKLIEKPEEPEEETPELREKRKKDWRFLVLGIFLMIGVLYGLYWLLFHVAEIA